MIIMNDLINTINNDLNDNNILQLLGDYNMKDYLDIVSYDDKKYKQIYLEQNNICDIVLKCWKKGYSTEIKNNCDKKSYMKILEGCLLRENFKNINNQLKLYNNQIIKNNDIIINTYNMEYRTIALQDTISLHIYIHN